MCVCVCVRERERGHIYRYIERDIKRDEREAVRRIRVMQKDIKGVQLSTGEEHKEIIEDTKRHKEKERQRKVSEGQGQKEKMKDKAIQRVSKRKAQ